MFKDIELVLIDPNYFAFELGLSLNRYEESDNQSSWIRKELCFGFLLISLRINWVFDEQKH